MNIASLCEQEFPQDRELAYLNHAAVSPWPSRSTRAVIEFAQENLVNGAENYKRWMAREMRLKDSLSKLINSPSPDDIALLKNTSEAISVVAGGLSWEAGDNVVTSNEEFPSNRIPWEAQENHGVELREVPILGDAENQLMSACDERTRILTISSVQYGSGYRVDLDRLGRFCRERGILFCVDAIQSIGAHRIDVQASCIDFTMADAHKWMLGPEGIALFYCRKEVREKLKIHQHGWHMVEHAGDYDRHEWELASSARRFECGSPNMLGIYALDASVSLLDEVGVEVIEKEIAARVRYLADRLEQVPGIELLSRSSALLPSGIITFKPGDSDAKEVHAGLMKRRVICANRFGGIRFSPHFYTPYEKLDRAIEILKELI